VEVENDLSHNQQYSINSISLSYGRRRRFFYDLNFTIIIIWFILYFF